MKKPALAGYSHVEGEDLEDLCTATYPPRPLSRGEGGTDPKLDDPLNGKGEQIRRAPKFCKRISNSRTLSCEQSGAKNANENRSPLVELRHSCILPLPPN